MNCPRCGNPVTLRKRYCDNCGADISVYRKIIRLSNNYYNSGLARAKVRDLTGAIEDLKKSLEYNKKNIDARNLLGLIYYEMGETVAALTEWVISKNFRGDGNDAEVYLEMVQDNPNELDNTNQAIRKYNLALQAAREQNDDTAILQLKKVLNLHPGFIRAMQLIALLLIRNGDYEKAEKYLQRALKIDVANTTALRYMAEIRREEGEQGIEKSSNYYRDSEPENNSPGRGITAVTSYREDKPNIMSYVNLLLGVIIGIVVVYYLIVPTMRNNIREEYESKKVDYSAELSTKSATITQQEKKIDSLSKQVEELQATIDSIDTTPVTVEVGTESYEEFFDIWHSYREMVSREYSDDELQELALRMWSMNTEGLENESAKAILKEMQDDIYPHAARRIYKNGKALYDNSEYEAAAHMLEAAVAFNGTNDAAMYYLGKSYQALENYEQAIYYYRLMLEVCPNSTLKDYIPQRLHECGVTEE